MSEIKRKLTAEDFAFVQVDDKIYDQKFEGKPIGFFKDAWLRFKQNKASVVAALIILFIVLMAIFAPMCAKYSYREQHTAFGVLPPRIPGLEKLGICDGSTVIEIQASKLGEYEEKGCVMKVLEEYTWTYRNKEIPMLRVKINQYIYKGAGDHYFWFGTDNIGRDQWVRLWRGTRISLLIGFCSVLINCLIGVVYGSISGYYGGKVDMVMMRITEIINAFPRIVVVTLFIMVFGTGMFSIIMSLVIKDWVSTARMVRSQFYRFKGREYVLAARTLGVKDMALIFRHILPNSIGPIITSSMIAIPTAIFSESFLAYIGLGLQAPEPSIGVMLSRGQKVLLQYPSQVVFPAIIISLLMISFNLFGNGLRDAFDPTLRGAE